MSKKVCKYRMFCNTEQAYTYKWDSDVPTTCPNNTMHEIDTNSIAIIDSVSNNDVTITSKDYTSTNGYYRMEGRVVDLPHTEPVVKSDFWFSFNIVVYGMRFNTDIDQVGDTIDIIAAPDTLIGVLIAPCGPSTDILYVNDTVYNNVIPGFYITINDGVNSEEFMVVGVSKETLSIQIEKPLQYHYNPMACMYLNIYIARNFKINNPDAYKIGYGTFGGKPIPANTKIRIVYHNNNLIQNKLFQFNIEYTY